MKKTPIAIVVQFELYHRAKAERDEQENKDRRRERSHQNLLAAAKKLKW